MHVMYLRLSDIESVVKGGARSHDSVLKPLTCVQYVSAREVIQMQDRFFCQQNKLLVAGDVPLMHYMWCGYNL